MHPIKKIYLKEFLIELAFNILFSFILGSLLFAAIYYQSRIKEEHEIWAYIASISLFLIVSLPKCIYDFKKSWKEIKRKYDH